MTTSTPIARRVSATALTSLALVIGAPVALAQSPDAFERALSSRQQHEQQRFAFVGSPDAIDRAVAARQAQRTYAATEARERALLERPVSTSFGPDALERAVATRTGELQARTNAMLDAREQAFMSRPISSPEPIGKSPVGVDWSDFGMGAGIGVGLVLLLLGVGAAVSALRRDDSRITTA